MTREQLLERVLGGWFAIDGEFRGGRADLSDQTYTDTSMLPADEMVQLLTVPGGYPSHGMSHIPSHDLGPAGHNGSQAVTVPKIANGSQPLMNTGDCHVPSFAVTPGQKTGMVRDAGFNRSSRSGPGL
jgi:hypothetical protein